MLNKEERIFYKTKLIEELSSILLSELKLDEVKKRESSINELINLFKREIEQTKDLIPKGKIIRRLARFLRDEIEYREMMIFECNLRKNKLLEINHKKRPETLNKINKKIKDLEGSMDVLVKDLQFSNNLLLSKINMDKQKLARITNVSFYNGNKNKTNTFKTGKKMIVKINYFANKKIEKPVFGVGIHRDDGIHVTGPNTKFHNFFIDSIEGKGEVEYKIENLPLLKGIYFLTVAIHPYNSLIPYDHHGRRYIFKVAESNINDFGIVHIPCEWKIKKLK